MTKYCNRYLDDAPSVRAGCERHLASKAKCLTCPNRDIHTEVIDLRAELAAARKDGERLDWLEATSGLIDCPTFDWHPDTGVSLRSEIDAALAASKPEGQTP